MKKNWKERAEAVKTAGEASILLDFVEEVTKLKNSGFVIVGSEAVDVLSVLMRPENERRFKSIQQKIVDFQFHTVELFDEQERNDELTAFVALPRSQFFKERLLFPCLAVYQKERSNWLIKKLFSEKEVMPSEKMIFLQSIILKVASGVNLDHSIYPQSDNSYGKKSFREEMISLELPLPEKAARKFFGIDFGKRKHTLPESQAIQNKSLVARENN